MTSEDGSGSSDAGRIESGRQRVEDTVSTVVGSANELASSIGEEALAKGDVAVALVVSQTSGAAIAITKTIDAAASRASDTIGATGDAIAWIIEHVDHVAVVDRESGVNYHRIRAVGDASEFLHQQLDGIGLEDYDIRIEASIDSTDESEDHLIVEVFRQSTEGVDPIEGDVTATIE